MENINVGQVSDSFHLAFSKVNNTCTSDVRRAYCKIQF